MYGFADAAGTGLADEEIPELHVISHPRGEPQHDARCMRGLCPEASRQRRVVPANQDQLHVVEALGDAAHQARSMAAEHDDARGPVRIELQLAQFGAFVQLQVAVEVGTDDHARGLVDARRVAARPPCLGHGMPCAADPMLRLMRFDPEVRRKIRKVREHRDERRIRAGRGQRLEHGAVEVRDQAHDQIGLGLLPVAAQLADERFMAYPDQRLQNAQLLCQAQSPATRQAHVVVMFRLDAGGSAKDIPRIQNFEKIDETNMPIPALLPDRHVEGGCCGAVTAPGIDVDEIDGFQRQLRKPDDRPGGNVSTWCEQGMNVHCVA